MIRRTAPITASFVLFAFGLLMALGAGEVLCAADDDCAASDECGSDDGCILGGCSCYVPTVLFDPPDAPCLLVPSGMVVQATPRPPDGIPVSIVRPPA